jgi:hypothetical protein
VMVFNGTMKTTYVICMNGIKGNSRTDAPWMPGYHMVVCKIYRLGSRVFTANPPLLIFVVIGLLYRDFSRGFALRLWLR